VGIKAPGENRKSRRNVLGGKAHDIGARLRGAEKGGGEEAEKSLKNQHRSPGPTKIGDQAGNPERNR